MFFNELKTLHELGTSMVSWEQFTDMLSRDERIGKTHMQLFQYFQMVKKVLVDIVSKTQKHY